MFSILDLMAIVQMQICIMTLIGVMIPLRVRSSDTIVDVKKIFDKARYPVHEQRLVFDDCRLEDSQTLANYNTQERSNIQLQLQQSSCLNHSLCLKKKWRIEKTLLFMRFSY
jgi:hypothetical protein